MFKYILQEASSPAKVQFINGLFGKQFPVDSTVTLVGTEYVGSNDDTLAQIRSDCMIEIGETGFVIRGRTDNTAFKTGIYVATD